MFRAILTNNYTIWAGGVLVIATMGFFSCHTLAGRKSAPQESANLRREIGETPAPPSGSTGGVLVRVFLD